MLAILPEIEQSQLYNTWNTKLPAYDRANETTVSSTVELYMCPSHMPPQRLFQTAFLGQDTTWAYASYVGNLGSDFIVDYQDWGPLGQPDGVLYRQSKIRPADIADGTSLTMMAGERVHRDMLLHPLWGFGFTGRVVGDASGEIQRHDAWNVHWGYSSFHPGGAQFLMSDGSVGMFSADLDTTIFRGLSTRAGSESETTRPF